MKVGVIDVGTNSVRVLISDGAGLGERRAIITRLGQGVDGARRLAPEAVARTISAIERFVARCRDADVEHVRIIATSAVRDAADREAFVDQVRARTGLSPDILSGRQEAVLAFAGATGDLDAPAPFLVCDIGGGSTELIVGSRAIETAASLDIGSVRLTERHVRSDPPTEAELDAARSDARAHVAPVLDGIGVATMVGVAGTITTAAALALDLQTYDPARVHRSVLTRAQVDRIGARLAAMTLVERASLPVMPSGREDVIVAGMIILQQVMDASGMMVCMVSESDILDGTAADLRARVRAEAPGASP